MEAGRLSSTAGKKVLAALFDADCDPETYAREHDLFLLTDETALQSLAHKVIAQQSALVQAYRGGKTAVLQALIGKGMALSRGRADPEKLAALLEKALNG